MDLLNQVYYGNTVKAWLISLGIIVAIMLLGKVVYWVFARIVRGLTSRTKSSIDDIIVELIERPTVFMLTATGIWFSLTLLKLPDGLDEAIKGSYSIILALLIGWLLVRLFEAFYEGILLPWAKHTENDLDDQLIPVLRKGVRLVIWVMAIIIGLNNAGYNVGAMLAGLGIGGLALAMAAKDTVSNVFGGFTIFADQPMRMGDRIKIAGYDGVVTEIGVRSTRLRTLEGREVTIPNSKFADMPVENISREPSRKVILNLGLTYDTSADEMETAIELLKNINEANPDTEDNTIIMFNEFGDFALNILYIYYIKKEADIPATQTAMHLAILRQFAEKGLEFAFPTQTHYNIDVKQ
jgi:MscS family membrane protein